MLSEIFLLLSVLSSACPKSRNQSYVTQYVTECDSSEFRNLENLIGSIHIHDPNSILRIRDKGLTDGQRMILSHYQNIEIVSSIYLNNTDRVVNVTYELIRNERQSIVMIRRSQNIINNADSIRKKIKLVVVIPFIRKQTTALLEQLHASAIHTPCRNSLHSTTSHDLILYHNEASNAPWIDDLRQKVDQYEFLNNCFRHIRILAANLTPEQNKYPLGSGYMWKQLFDEDGSISLRTLGYTHFFLMEPDTRPHQSYWLDVIMQNIMENSQEEFISTDWWMFGSLYRGSEDIGFGFLHINGNAIYHLSSNFLEFLQLVWQSYPLNSDRTNGYDYDIFQFMFNPRNYNITKRVWHKFRFSEFIQNCWHSGCANLENDVHTFLIHGKQMIQMMESGDKYSMSKINITSTSTSLTQLNSYDNHPPSDSLLTKLNIPINCLDNQQIRQHYLEEYSAKYSKAKHLLSNARRKQRKIIMTYYEEKGKQDNIDELQTIKESLLEENEKIKKFKEALKDKLIVYQQRIQFLKKISFDKDAEFCSTFEIQQLQNNPTQSIQTCTDNSPDSPIINDSFHLLHDDEQNKYSNNLLNNVCPISTTNENKLNIRFDDNETNIISLLTEDYNPIEINIKQSHTELIYEIDENFNNSISKKRPKYYIQWLKNYCQFLFISTLNNQFDRFKFISMILMISLAIFFIIFVNDLLEYFLIYLTKPSVPITILSSSNLMSKSLFTYLLPDIYKWTISWLLPFFRIFEFSA